jgi:hypothetical protein
MPMFFELFGVPWNDLTWRRYLATAGGWLIMEAPLIIWILYHIWKK